MGSASVEVLLLRFRHHETSNMFTETETHLEGSILTKSTCSFKEEKVH